MKNSDNLLEAIERIQKRLELIQLEKNEMQNIKDTFGSMDEYCTLLNENYVIFENNINIFINGINKLDDYVSNNVLEKYYKIMRENGSKVEYIYNKIETIMDDLKR